MPEKMEVVDFAVALGEVSGIVVGELGCFVQSEDLPSSCVVNVNDMSIMSNSCNFTFNL